MSRFFRLGDLRAYFLLCAVLGTAGAFAQNIEIQPPRKVQPTPQHRAAWLDNFFEIDEVWRFPNQRSFNALVDASTLSLGDKLRLKGLYIDSLTYVPPVRYNK